MRFEVCTRSQAKPGVQPSRYYDLVTALLKAEKLGMSVLVSLAPDETLFAAAVNSHLRVRTCLADLPYPERYPFKLRTKALEFGGAARKWELWLERRKPSLSSSGTPDGGM